MDLTSKYSIYIGTVRGTLYCTTLDIKSKIRYEFSKEASEISCMSWKNEDEIITGFKNGEINIYNAQLEKFLFSIDTLKNMGSIIGLGYLNNKILAISNKGKISLLEADKEIDKIETISSEKANTESAFQNMNQLNIIATGGEMNDLRLWDIETKKCIFKAKSLGHDQLNLPIKASIRGITFIPEEQNICCCSTKEGYILLYDSRAQRKPICKYFEHKASFTSITSGYKQRNILAGTTKGYIQYIDMTAGKCLKTFTGISGSVTCLVCDPVEPYFAATSLDRYLRIFDLNTKEVLFKQYLKQSLTKFLMKPNIKEEAQEATTSENGADDEYEEIFKNMEVVTEKSKKKRVYLPTAMVKRKKIKN